MAKPMISLFIHEFALEFATFERVWIGRLRSNGVLLNRTTCKQQLLHTNNNEFIPRLHLPLYAAYKCVQIRN